MNTLGSRCFLLSLLCNVLVSPAAGQEVEPGQRVRVTAADLTNGRLVAEVVRVDGDSLVLRRDGAIRALPRSSIEAIEMASGSHRHTLRGALVGGVTTGIVLGQDMLRTPGQCSGSGNYGQLCALFLAGAMAGGAVAGAIIGTAVRHDDWVSLSLDTSHAGLVGSPHYRRTMLFSVSIRPQFR